MDIKILFLTVKQVLCGADVAEDTRVTEGNFAQMRQQQTDTIT